MSDEGREGRNTPNQKVGPLFVSTLIIMGVVALPVGAVAGGSISSSLSYLTGQGDWAKHLKSGLDYSIGFVSQAAPLAAMAGGAFALWKVVGAKTARTVLNFIKANFPRKISRELMPKHVEEVIKSSPDDGYIVFRENDVFHLSKEDLDDAIKNNDQALFKIMTIDDNGHLNCTDVVRGKVERSIFSGLMGDDAEYYLKTDQGNIIILVDTQSHERNSLLSISDKADIFDITTQGFDFFR